MDELLTTYKNNKIVVLRKTHYDATDYELRDSVTPTGGRRAAVGAVASRGLRNIRSTSNLIFS